MRALSALVAAAVLVPILLFAVAAWRSHAIVVEESGHRAVKTAAIIEQQAAATMQLYRLVFRRVEDYLNAQADAPDPAALYDFLSGLDRDVGQVDAIFVIDPRGRLIAHSRYAPPLSVDVADRDYFIALLQSSEPIAIGRPITGRLSGERRLNIAFRLDAPDGQFGGAVAISASEEYFGTFYRATRESPTDVMSLVRADGTVLVRSPEVAADSTLQPGTTLAQLLAAGNGRVVRTSAADGVDRLWSLRQISGFPVFVAYGLDARAIRIAWFEDLRLYASIAVPAALLLLLAVAMALRRARQEEDALARLRREIAQRSEAEARREAAEAALRQAQKMEAVGQMTGGVAHDFNNLLMVILGNLDMAIGAAEKTEEVRRLLGTALKAAQRGGVLTQQLLAFSRRQMLHAETVDPNRLIEDFLPLVRQAASEAVSVRTRLAHGLVACRIDRTQFEAAILNLVVNARDAMPQGGSVLIETRNVSIPAEDRNFDAEAKPGLYAMVAIADTGTGMSRETLEKAFDPFFTTKEVGRGSGLGLSMIYGFVKQSGGHVRIESELGRGTSVQLFLPSSNEPLQERPVALEPETPHGSGTILIVEDDEDVAALATSMIETLGYQAVLARDANEALALLDEDRPIDLLFSDIVLAHGMSGDELARAARHLRPNLKVLLATGYAPQLAELQNGEGREFEVIAKPYRRAELAARLKALLTEPR
jgi:two-component system NtrC family sensor kinase